VISFGASALICLAETCDSLSPINFTLQTSVAADAMQRASKKWLLALTQFQNVFDPRPSLNSLTSSSAAMC
jgi:hypothetical protein